MKSLLLKLFAEIDSRSHCMSGGYCNYSFLFALHVQLLDKKRIRYFNILVDIFDQSTQHLNDLDIRHIIMFDNGFCTRWLSSLSTVSISLPRRISPRCSHPRPTFLDDVT